MRFTMNILKEVMLMKNNVQTIGKLADSSVMTLSNHEVSPFWIIVKKEMADHIHSWRFGILVLIIGLTCLGSLYVSMENIAEALSKSKANDVFAFLKLYTVSDGKMPPYFVFLSFLGPLLGISLGFDAINSEYSRGTISRILSQPIPRDFLITAKFTASLIIISAMFFLLSFLMMGIGILSIGINPTVEEFTRILLFTITSIVYVSFWLSLSILLSIKFSQASTSALSGISVWLFFTVFYSILVNVVYSIIIPAGRKLSVSGEQTKLSILRLTPNQLFNDITNVLLTPEIRSLGPLTMEQVRGAIPTPLPVFESLMLVWPQFVGLVSGTILCFFLSYLFFMRKDVRTLV